MDRFLETKKEKKLKKQRDSKYIYQNELDKVCFRYVVAYKVFKGFAKRTVCYKVFHNIAFNIAKIQNIMNTKEVLLQWLTNFLIKGCYSQRNKKIKNWQKNHTSPRLENFKNLKHINPLEAIFEVQI